MCGTLRMVIDGIVATLSKEMSFPQLISDAIIFLNGVIRTYLLTPKL
jgi:hypothetical protein